MAMIDLHTLLGMAPTQGANGAPASLLPGAGSGGSAAPATFASAMSAALAGRSPTPPSAPPAAAPSIPSVLSAPGGAPQDGRTALAAALQAALGAVVPGTGGEPRLPAAEDPLAAAPLLPEAPVDENGDDPTTDLSQLAAALPAVPPLPPGHVSLHPEATPLATAAGDSLQQDAAGALAAAAAAPGLPGDPAAAVASAASADRGAAGVATAAALPGTTPATPAGDDTTGSTPPTMPGNAPVVGETAAARTAASTGNVPVRVVLPAAALTTAAADESASRTTAPAMATPVATAPPATDAPSQSPTPAAPTAFGSIAAEAVSASPPAASPSASVAGSSPAGPSAAPANATLHQLPGSAQWPAELGQQLLVHGRDGARQIELRLSPPELGPLSVTLSMSERSAQLQFVAHHVQVREALEQAIPQLREALASQGITLGEAGVSDRRGDPQGGAGFTAGNRTGGEASPDDGGEAGAAGQAAAAALLAAGRVDIHV